MKTTFAVGNLGKDAEIKTIKDKQYYSFSLACREGKDKTTWVTVLCESRNEQLGQYLTKGRPVAVVGRTTINAYISTKDGSARAEETIWADKLTLISQGEDKDKAAATQAPSAPAAVEAENSDLPF